MPGTCQAAGVTSVLMVSSFDWSNPQHRKHTISLAAASESVSLLIPFQESFFLHDLDLRNEALADQASGCHPCALAAVAVTCLGRVSALEVQDVCSLFGRTAGTWVASSIKKEWAIFKFYLQMMGVIFILYFGEICIYSYEKTYIYIYIYNILEYEYHMIVWTYIFCIYI